MDGTILIGIGFFSIALLYSTVGHAGASGYLAAMAMLAFPPEVMKPTALLLNIAVALIASLRFRSAGLFSWRLFWPFAAASVPLSFIGGGLTVDPNIYKSLVGVALLFSASYLIVRRGPSSGADPGPNLPAVPVSLATGGLIGLLSGLTGVGGGIFLSPALVMARWAGVRRTSAVAAPFILVNSVAGLAGHLQKGGAVPEALPAWGMMVIAGGFIGASLGATRMNGPVLRLLLGVMLFFAGVKMVAI